MSTTFLADSDHWHHGNIDVSPAAVAAKMATEGSENPLPLQLNRAKRKRNEEALYRPKQP